VEADIEGLVEEVDVVAPNAAKAPIEGRRDRRALADAGAPANFDASKRSRVEQEQIVESRGVSCLKRVRSKFVLSKGTTRRR
jgi:hypothetical protein